LFAGDGVGRTCMARRDEVLWHGEDGSAHRQHAYEGTVVVECPLDIGDRDAIGAGQRCQESGGWICAVQCDDTTGSADRICGTVGGREGVASAQAHTSLGSAES